MARLTVLALIVLRRSLVCAAVEACRSSTWACRSATCCTSSALRVETSALVAVRSASCWVSAASAASSRSIRAFCSASVARSARAGWDMARAAMAAPAANRPRWVLLILIRVPLV